VQLIAVNQKRKRRMFRL